MGRRSNRASTCTQTPKQASPLISTFAYTQFKIALTKKHVRQLVTIKSFNSFILRAKEKF